MKAVIAGAGIGGLSAAIALANAGFEVQVVERAPALTEVGAGIQLSPNAMKGLEALGVADAVLALASLPERLELRIGRTGKRIFSIPMGQEALRRYGAPYAHIHRADLIGVLERAAISAGARILLNARVLAYANGSERISLGLDTGAILEADLLVGADGSRSQVRTQLLGDAPARFTGSVAWRFTVPADVAPDLPHAAIVWAGPGRHLVTYRIRRGEMINFVGVVERDCWREESWDEPGDPRELVKDFGSWAAPIPDMLVAAGACNLWALYDREPLARWSGQRVTLLGDACHAMPPFQAQGAAMAIEDAVVLARCLAARGVSESALGAYEALRKPRTSRVLASARGNMRIFHRSSVWARAATYGPMKIANRLFPELVRSRQDWIYGYDVRRIEV